MYNTTRTVVLFTNMNDNSRAFAWNTDSDALVAAMRTADRVQAAADLEALQAACDEPSDDAGEVFAPLQGVTKSV